jgi:hypothetical protein
MTAQKPNATADPTREQLMALWREARDRREAADLGSAAYRRALEDIARIEIEIARIERALDPPRM